MARPKKLKDEDIKRSRTVSITDNEFKELAERFGTLTAALLSLLHKRNKAA